MRMRREMPSTLFASPEHRALSKRIRKLVRRDLRCSNTRAIQAAIEQNRGSKVFLKPLGRSHLAKVRTADGRELTSHSEILAEVERFYGRLYSSRAERPSVQGANDPRAPLTRHYTEDIPEVDIGEIRTALGQLKNGRAPGDDVHRYYHVVIIIIVIIYIGSENCLSSACFSANIRTHVLLIWDASVVISKLFFYCRRSADRQTAHLMESDYHRLWTFATPKLL
ncbi:hypothetical protein K1T71_002957 [Dendrolimus kikuchii]|uniref:Uncharacterized protein n=1 Tax=Dendrolimus kikuchii TaxID=765133 RepID=A0ACC1DAH9_9NEOP|nr:hypothetical protein K1T71_002957 [Dendrolimus kikuchii]